MSDALNFIVFILMFIPIATILSIFSVIGWFTFYIKLWYYYYRYPELMNQLKNLTQKEK